VVADGRLAREHHRVRPVEDGVGDVRGLRASGAALVDHRVEHLRGRDDRDARLVTPPDDPFLDHRDVLQRALDAQIPACDHHAVGGVDDAFEVVDGHVALYLGDDRDVDAALLEFGADAVDVLAVADETRRDEVDLFLGRDVEFALVLFGDHRQTEVHPGDVDALPAAEAAAVFHARPDDVTVD
jgi:hypothetical protein